MQQKSETNSRFRIHLLGAFEVHKHAEDGTWTLIEKAAWGSNKYPQSVLKCLLAAPGRRLPRWKLLECLWPDSDLADKYLNNAISLIRTIIGKDLVKMSDSSYELAGPEVIWVDSEVCQQTLKTVENRGGGCAQAVPMLEEALSYLERGGYLEAESATWCHALRKPFEMLLRQCRLWLAEGYEAQGKLLQAGLQYQALCYAMPPDEDVLGKWIAMLTRARRWQEAIHVYQEVKEYCEVQGYSLVLPAPDNKPPWGHIIVPTFSQEDSHMRVFLRRSLLLGLMAMPFSLMTVPATTDADVYLAQCQEHIHSCWRLLHGREITIAHFLLCSWLPPLETFLTKSSPYQSKAANLASQGYILAGLVAILQRQNGAAEWCRRQAVEYAELAGDIHLKVAALKHLATQYNDAECFLLTRNIYEQALPLIAETTPLLRSRTELGLALAEARLGRRKEALGYWDAAQEHFPSYPEELDPAYMYADCGKASFNHYGGLMYLEFGQPEKAWELFDAVRKLRTSIPERTTNEIVLCKVQATIAQQDLDRTTTHLQEGIQGAVALKSEMRLHDSRKLYQQARILWPNERSLRDLEELFH